MKSSISWDHYADMRLFEDVILVEQNDESVTTPDIIWRLAQAEQEQAQAHIHVEELPRLPKNFQDLCSPRPEKAIRSATEFPIVVTDGKGKELYGYVRQLFLAPNGTDKPKEGIKDHLSVCIIGKAPRYHLYAWILRLFHARYQLDRSNKLNIHFLQLLRSSMDHARRENAITLEIPDYFSCQVATYTFPWHPMGAFSSPSPELHTSYERFLKKIKSPSVLLTMLSALLCEKKLLFVSDDVQLLRGASYAMTLLIQPFCWKFLLVPVLSKKLLSYLSAPIPFVMGITKEIYKEMIAKPLTARPFLQDVLIFDLQACHVDTTSITESYPTLCIDFSHIGTPRSNDVSKSRGRRNSIGIVEFQALGSCTSPRSSSSSNSSTNGALDPTLVSFEDALGNTFYEKKIECIQACCLAFWLHLIGKEEDFLMVTPNGGEQIFDQDKYIYQRKNIDGPLVRQFLSHFIKTSTFQAYFSKRSCPKHSTTTIKPTFSHRSLGFVPENVLEKLSQSKDYRFTTIYRMLLEHQSTGGSAGITSTPATINDQVNRCIEFVQQHRLLSGNARMILAKATFQVDHCARIIKVICEVLENSLEMPLVKSQSTLNLVYTLIVYGSDLFSTSLLGHEGVFRYFTQLSNRSSGTEATRVSKIATAIIRLLNQPRQVFTRKQAVNAPRILPSINYQKVSLGDRDIPPFQELHEAVQPRSQGQKPSCTGIGVAIHPVSSTAGDLISFSPPKPLHHANSCPLESSNHSHSPHYHEGEPLKRFAHSASSPASKSHGPAVVQLIPPGRGKSLQ